MAVEVRRIVSPLTLSHRQWLRAAGHGCSEHNLGAHQVEDVFSTAESSHLSSQFVAFFFMHMSVLSACMSGLPYCVVASKAKRDH